MSTSATTQAPTPPSLSTRCKRVARWAFINGLIGATMWYAIYGGSRGAGNCLIAFVWFQLFMCCLVMLLLIVRNHSPTDPLADIKAKGRSVPAWLSHAVGLAGIATFMWNGWWFCGIVQIINEIVEVLMYSDDPHEHTEGARRRAREAARESSTPSGSLNNDDFFAQLEREHAAEQQARGRIERRDRPRRIRTPQSSSQPSEETPALESRDTTPRIELD